MSSNLSNIQSMSEYGELFACVAEQLKMPFIQISSMAAAMDVNHPESVISASKGVGEISSAAMELLDGFLLSIKIQDQSEIELEPVPIGSVMYDIANSARGYARMTGSEVRLEVSSKCGLVMANPKVVKSALTNLAYSFINASMDTESKPVRIVADYSAGSVVTGVFSNTLNLSKDLFENAKHIKGIAHQPLQKFSGDNSAGVFVADSLMSGMGSGLGLVRYGGGVGLATRLMPSSQLALV